MSSMEKVHLDNGKEWYVGSWVSGLGVADVIIPIEQLGEMTDEEIGGYVRAAMKPAMECHLGEVAYEEARSIKSREEDRQRPKPGKTKKPGYIYLMHGLGTEWYKIGLSKNPSVRAQSLGTKSPFQIEILKTYKTKNMKPEEEYWHERFSSKRTEGEWFTLNDADILEFVRYGEERDGMQ